MSSAELSVAVLLSAGCHPVSGLARACRGDAMALGLARSLRAGKLYAIHAGEVEEPALTDYLAYGACRIEVLPVPAGCDVMPALVHRLRDVDLIVSGGRTEIGMASGLLPYTLAHALGRPVIGNVLEAHVGEDGVRLRQFLPKGKRRGVRVPLPAVMTVHPLAPIELHYAYSRRVAGRIVVVPPEGFPSPSPDGDWTIEADVRRPVPLKAQERKAGHARLMSAIATEAKAGVVAIEGSCVDKAQIMLSYLREHRLVEF